MTKYIHFNVQLKDAATGKAIITAGGVAMVCKNATPTKHALKSDAIGTSASNPKSLTRGNLDFWVDQSTLVSNKVDLYIQCPGGQFVVLRDVDPSGPNEVLVNTINPHQQMVIPFDQADYSVVTETDTGFDLPAANTAIIHADSASAAVRITAVDATETFDLGTATADSGDPDGLMSAVALDSLGIVRDNGALLGTLAGHISDGKSIVVTTSTGSDTAKLFAYLSYTLFN